MEGGSELIMDCNDLREYNEIIEYYNSGKEIDRLQKGIGKIEFVRTKEIISRYLPSQKQVIYDIGGGTGEYSRWLSQLGHEVHLLELAPKAVVCAKEINTNLTNPIFNIEVADALSLNRPNESVDIVLLMGPLYHLIRRSNRLKALQEARRVLKTGGIIFASAISRYSSSLWGLSVFGQKNDFIDDDAFIKMIDRELTTGHHIRPKKYPRFIARSFFHLPEELRIEIEEAGFKNEKMLAVEGPIWIVPAFEEKWENENSRERLLKISQKVETDKNIMGMSPHLLAIATKVPNVI